MSLEQCRSGDGVPTSIISEAFFTRGVFTTKAHADNMIGSIDTDRSGALSYDEFMAAIDGSNLMQAGKIRKFLRSLVKEYPDITKFYESRRSSAPLKKGRHKGARSSRIIPTEEDVNKLHFLKSREAMMKMGVQFPPEEEEEERHSDVAVNKVRPSTAGATRYLGMHQALAKSTKEGGGSRPTSGTIRRSFRSDETFDRGHKQLPTIDVSFTSRLTDIQEVASPLADRRFCAPAFGSVENDTYNTLSTATPADVMLGAWGPARSCKPADRSFEYDDADADIFDDI